MSVFIYLFFFWLNSKFIKKKKNKQQNLSSNLPWQQLGWKISYNH